MTKKAIKMFLIGKLSLSGMGIIHEEHHPHTHSESRVRWSLAREQITAT